MEEQIIKKFSFKDMLNNAHRYGLVMGGVMIVIGMLYYVFEVNMFSIGFSIIGSLVNISIIIITMVMSTKNYRIKYMDGKINYGKCMLNCWITAFVALLISGIFSFLFYYLFDPAYMPAQIEKFREMMETKLPEEKLDEIINRMMDGLSPLKQLQSTLISSIVFSGIVALITSIFIKKKDDTFESNFQ